MSGKHYILLLFSAMMLMASCKKDEDEPPASYYNGHGYFPDEDGIERVYRVDSIAWDEFTNTVDTFIYDYKEVIESHYTDNEGRFTQRIERYLYDSASAAWVIWKVTSANRTASTAEVVEDNYRYLRLVFPPALNETWNGNVHNTLGSQEYQINAIHQPETTPSFQFDSTLTVIQIDELTAFTDKYAQERYASRYGLYYTLKRDLETNISGVITSGYTYESKLISFTRN